MGNYNPAARRGYAKVAIAKKFKNIIQPKDYKIIPLTKGRVALVDNEDFDVLKDIGWQYMKGYAYNVGDVGAMHRFILKAPKGIFVDHINRDPLDNRRSNLRLCTSVQNSGNIGIGNANKTGYKGVSKNKATGKYMYILQHKRVRYRKRGFDTPELAAKAYNELAVKLRGEFAYLNPV